MRYLKFIAIAFFLLLVPAGTCALFLVDVMPSPDSHIERVRHVVLLRLRPDVAGTEIDDATAALNEMKRTISGITSLHAGRNTSGEGLGRGYDYLFVVGFHSVAARDAYLQNPRHAMVARQLQALSAGGIDGILVADLDIEPSGS